MTRVRRALGTRAVGHTGTLDPFATGLLVLVVGGATRLARFVEAGRKEYTATVRLGWRTTTDDLTGQPIDQPYAGPWPDHATVARALADLAGMRMQRPPPYSAKRIAGRRSYDLARAGAVTELQPVPIDVHGIELARYDPPIVDIRAVVGPGTYIRAIARDLGQALGTGGHLEALRRVRVGPFRVEDAIPLGQVDSHARLLAPRELVADLPRVAVAPPDAVRIRHGQAVGAGAEPGQLAALVDGDVLVAVAAGREGRWQPMVVLEAP